MKSWLMHSSQQHQATRRQTRKVDDKVCLFFVCCRFEMRTCSASTAPLINQLSKGFIKTDNSSSCKVTLRWLLQWKMCVGVSCFFRYLSSHLLGTVESNVILLSARKVAHWHDNPGETFCAKKNFRECFQSGLEFLDGILCKTFNAFLNSQSYSPIKVAATGSMMSCSRNAI